MMFDLVGFGETMVRLSTCNFQRLEQATTLDVNIGGAELNALVTASKLGLRTSYITRLARNPLGRLIQNRAREHGVDTSYVLWSNEDRQGIYFLEFGALPRATAVLYDRANSAMARIQPGMVDWDGVFSGTRAFHMTGITPALSKGALEVTTEALSKAHQKKVLISFDLNYRAKLWTQEQAKAGLSPLMKYVDILMTTEEDTARVFQIEGRNWEEVARKLADTFGFKIVLITIRETPSVWRNNWLGIALKDGRIYEDRKYEMEVVDRVGSGDAFAGGFLYSYLTKGDTELALKYGNAAAVLKHSNPGDFGYFTREEVEALMAGKAGLRISR